MKPRPFAPVKMICGLIAAREELFSAGKKRLTAGYGRIDCESRRVPFDFTPYYERETGQNLERMFVSFERLIRPESLADLKLETNGLEEELSREYGPEPRPVNLDPGFINSAALILATTKDFSHRVPLHEGIYAHLEILFGKTSIRTLDWTYPDFKSGCYDPFLLKARKLYLEQLRGSRSVK